MKPKGLIWGIMGFSMTVLPLFSADNARDLYLKGVAAHQRLDRYQAYEYFHEAIKRNPNFSEPIEGLAFLLFEMGQYRQSLELVQRAQKLNPFNLQLQTLEGRIEMGLGNFDRAEAVFKKVLAAEPNNIEAKLGMSDLDVVYGTWKKAIQGYREILHGYPDNSRALLSLALIYDELADETNAEHFIKNAVSLYPNDVGVRYWVANHYRRYGHLEQAKSEAQLALQIEPKNRDTLLLAAHVQLDLGRPDEAVALLRPAVEWYPNDALLAYELAYAYEQNRQIDEAIRIYYQALEITPSDEWIREALEQCVIHNKPLDDPNRSLLSKIHFEWGNQFKKQAKTTAYFQSYRKGLQIKNKDIEGLKGYADCCKRFHYLNKYYSVLQTLHQLSPEDRDINDQLNIYRRAVEQTVSRRWKIDPDSLRRDTYTLSCFALNLPQQVLHYHAPHLLLQALTHVMNSLLTVTQTPAAVVSDFAEAFQQANQNGSDYFLLLRLTEKERSLHIQAEVYASQSGILVDSFSLMETGNHRLQTVLINLTQMLESRLPTRGTLLKTDFGTGIANLGLADGLQVGDRLFIIRKGMLSSGGKGFSLEYDDKNILGTFTVTAVDDCVSEGTIENRFFYDLINEGDRLIRLSQEKIPFKVGEPLPSDLYKELLKLN